MSFLDDNAEHFREKFSASRVPPTTQHPPTEWPTLQSLLRDISIEPLVDDSQIARAAGLLDEFHYLGAPNPVGERIWYAALDPGGEWLGVLLFTAAGDAESASKWENVLAGKWAVSHAGGVPATGGCHPAPPAAGTPAGVRDNPCHQSGGVAALNHRLQA
jgi:hypothetical protein